MDGFKLSTLDISIMLLYAVFIIGYGLYHAKRSSSEDYFLGGRSLTWPIVGIALFAANISSSSLVGLASSAFQTDTHVFNYEWLAAVVLVFFAIFFLPFYLKSKVYTMPEFLERRYDSRSRYYFSFVTVVGNVLIDTAAALYVGTIVLKLIFPSLSTFTIVSILALAAALYTIPGGLNSVIQTEVVQAILLVGGSIILTYFALQKAGGWDAVLSVLDSKAAAGEFVNENGIRLKDSEDVLSMIRSTGDGFRNFVLGSGGDTFMPWTGLVFGAPILGFYFWANNQFMVQRVLGAKDLQHGRRGALFAGFLKLPVIFIMVFPGTIAILLYSGVDISNINYTLADGTICSDLSQCPNATYPVLLFDLLPKGLLGLVLAGLLAAMMSSISATFNSASTLVTMDFIKPLSKNISDKNLVRAGQIVTLILVVLASAWAPVIEKFGSLWEYLQEVLAYIAPPVASAFILGLFWKRSNGHGSIASLIFGLIFTVGVILSTLFDWSGVLNDMHFLHRTFYLFVACSIVNVIVSLATSPPPAEKVKHYTWNRTLLTAETQELQGVPWYKNYRYMAIVLLITTTILVAVYW